MSSPAYDLFSQPPLIEVRAPDIRIEAPSQPGSKSSQRGAEAVEPFRNPQWRKVLIALSKIPPGKCLSREEIASRTGIKDCSLCGRLSTRELRLWWVERVEDACVSSAKVLVDGYRLNENGWGLFK